MHSHVIYQFFSDFKEQLSVEKLFSTIMLLLTEVYVNSTKNHREGRDSNSVVLVLMGGAIQLEKVT